MIQKLARFIISLSITSNAIGQINEDTLYFNEHWDFCKKEEASFYRIIKVDPELNPVGIVKDYYISGKLKFEGEAILIDNVNSANSKWKNKVTRYYENGDKEYENNYDLEGNQIGPRKTWDENGIMDIAINFTYKELKLLEKSQFNSIKIELKKIVNDSLILEKSKIYGFKLNSGKYEYYFVDSENLTYLYLLYSEDFIYESSASNIIDNIQISIMEFELKERGFEKIEKVFKDPQNGDGGEFWTRKDYPYSIYLQTEGCFVDDCLMRMYSNSLFTNPD
jgi:hypothetical protein